MAIGVTVAEDSLLVREGIVHLLEAETELTLVASCGTLDELIESVNVSPPDVVVTDIRMPPTRTDEGIRAADALRVSHPHVGVVVLSQYVEADYALALFDSGSARRAYLLKEQLAYPGQLARAIREVASGGSVVDPLVVEALVGARRGRADSMLSRLSPRELDVLSHIATGANNAAIGRQLGLSERAVEKHIGVLFSKLDLSEEIEVNRRVKAVLVFLAETGSSPASLL